MRLMTAPLRRRAAGWPSSPASRSLALLLLGAAQLAPVAAVFVDYQNCLPSYRLDSSNPQLLQFVPFFVDAVFDTAHPAHPLNITVYGNTTGQQYQGTLPPPDSPEWEWANVTNGKIENIGSSKNYTTLSAEYDVVTYEAFANRTAFCSALVQGECPLIPLFNVSRETVEPSDLYAFYYSHDFQSSYAFSTISTTFHVISGDTNFGDVACVSAQLTPDLGSTVSNLLTWIPAAILILKGLATVSAAIWSPWGSTDIFRWSSNYGRDEDLLRLVTPGFGDCLQYIQFVVLTGALTLQYPGFFQPAVSQASWSLLLFNESYVSHGPGVQSLVDGLYVVNGTYGMAQMSQLVGMTEPVDIWACMAVWLLVIAGSVALLCQFGFFGRWIYRTVTYTSEEDLRQKNLPFTLGNMVRLLFNFFILPIVALSLFQLVLAPSSPASVLACAALLLVIMIVSAGWILHVIFTTKPRTLLFDDMPTVLLYGPLYNTYDDRAAPFALIPVFITFMRGVALGAIQPSGIAQLIVLAVCEVILILTLNGFRPFQGQTSMNLYHTFFAIVRLTTVLLMIAFVPSLGVTEAPKGWIGYVILLLHACVLVFGFFLNSAQTLIEVLLRSFGAGGNAHRGGAVRGSILSWRMLKKRQTRPDTAENASMLSSAAILRDGTLDGRTTARTRSMSASSQQLLGRTSGFDNFSTGGDLASPDPDGESAMAFSLMADRPSLTSRDTGDNYYRAPRPRKATLDALSGPGNRTRNNDVPYADAPGGPISPGPHARDLSYDPGAGHDSPAPAFFRERQGSGGENIAPRTDYAVREVDQYYRGPALNDQPTRKLKTGPADPEGPAIVAQSWFQKMLFGVTGKKKDQSKGFEVVRSSRMPPAMRAAAEAEALEMQDTTPALHQEPYFDSPPKKPHVQADETTRSQSPEDDFLGKSHAQPFDFGLSRSPPHLRPDGEAVGAGLAAEGLLRSASRATEGSNYDRQPHFTSDETTPEVPLEDATPEPIMDLPARPPTLSPQPSASHLQAPNRLSATPSDIVHSAPGQDWLRAVDALTWDHSAATPPIPQRDHRRTLSREIPTSSYIPPTAPDGPITRNTSRATSKSFLADVRAATLFEQAQHPLPSGHSLSTADDSDEDEERRSDDDENDFPLPPRPANFTVHHRRAADSINRNSFGAHAAMRASVAEVVDWENQSPPAAAETEPLPARHSREADPEERR